MTSEPVCADRGFMTPQELRVSVAGRWAVAPASSDPTRGVGTDTRCDLSGRVFFALHGDRHDAHDHLLEAVRAGARILVVEESKWRRIRLTTTQPCAVLVVPETRAALQAAAAAWRQMLTGTRVFGITGSAGKTTTRRLIEGVLATEFQGSASPKSFNNDVGVPITLCGGRRGDHYLLAEIGMNAPGEIAMLSALAKPDVAVVTMVGRAHLEGLGSVDAIMREKFSLVSALSAGGLAVVRGDNSLLDAALEGALPAGVRVIRFGEGVANHVRLQRRTPRVGGGQHLDIVACGRSFAVELALEGAHNAINALAAIAMGIDSGLSDQQISRGLASVRPSEMRFVRQQFGDLTIYNDAYNANPDAVLAALSTFTELVGCAQRRVVVLGDMLELGAQAPALHEEIGRAVARGVGGSAPDVAIFVGPLAAHAAAACRSVGGCKVVQVAELNPLGVSRVVSEFATGDAILLKGSRGAALERLLASLQERLAA
ncbi:MAG: UDP-N-acetylmuramoyl-tripeptide--D-alanyl-D-alanine ligase [Phycisphaerales bacterium]|nr:UDP-N-acetylmuramoyl-tripeptide--D-alanyl-D-alanine ligase [Phycisphaerales bacterium]